MRTTVRSLTPDIDLDAEPAALSPVRTDSPSLKAPDFYSKESSFSSSVGLDFILLSRV